MAFRKDNNTNKPKSFTKIAIGLISLNVTVCSVSGFSVR